MTESDQQLADRLVALLDGKTTKYNPRAPTKPYRMYLVGEKVMGYLPADKFVRDWRVAGAVMEKTLAIGDDAKWLYFCEVDLGFFGGESLPRAICEAGCEALEQTHG